MRGSRQILHMTLALSIAAVASPSRAMAAPFTVTVSIENVGPASGTFLTPFWVGFHNGTFDLYDLGVAAFAGLEALAEDGSTGPLSARFTAEGAGTTQATLPGPSGPIAPGDTAQASFTLEGTDAASRFFSYASMVIPSNDAFIANGNPMARQIFDGSGNFLGADFIVTGAMVLDAGTETNDEVPANTAFFGQMAPNTGMDENGVVHAHAGFIPGGPILSSAQFANANFLNQGYQVARIRVTAQPVPEPTSTALLAIGAGAGVWVTVRRRRLA